jgi:drug/metabolite transporter (DMT)-like permease
MKKKITKQTFTDLLLIILLFVLFASIFTLQKKTLSTAEPFFTIGSRMFIAGLILLLYTKYKYKEQIKTLKKHYLTLFLLSLYNIYLTNVFEIYGLTYIDSSKVCLIYSLSPFFSLLLTHFIIHENITKKKILGLLIGLLGIFIGIQTTKNNGLFTLTLKKEELSIIFAVLFSTIGWIQLKKIIILNYNIITANGISMFFGGILILLHSLIFGENWNILPIINVKNYLILTLTTIIISNVICYNLFGFLLKKFSVTFMNFAGLTTPIFAGIFGYIFLQETITIFFIISIPIIFLGLLIFYGEEK